MQLALLAVLIFWLQERRGDPSSGDNATQPCQDRSQKSRYEEFVKRHVLKDVFDRADKAQWASYLEKKGLCGRTPVQSFIDEDEGRVSQVCRSSGKRVENGGNLCISRSPMTVYDVRSGKNYGKCRVTSVIQKNHSVVVACNKVDNACCPVHYQKYENQRPSDQNCSR